MVLGAIAGLGGGAGGLFGSGGIGGMFGELSGANDVQKANQISAKSVKAMLKELGGPEGSDSFFSLLQGLFGQAASQYQSSAGRSDALLAGGYTDARAQRRAAHEASLNALKQSYAEAQQRVGAQAAGAVEASLKAQRQALAAMGQNAVSSGLGGAPARAAAGQISAQATDAMSGAFAQQSGQLGGLAQQQGQALAQTQTGFGQDMANLFVGEGGARAGNEMQLGQLLGNLYQNQGQMQQGIAGMRLGARGQQTHIVPPSMLDTIAGGLGTGLGLKSLFR